MKKIRLTAFVAIFVFAFALAGCSAGNDSEKEELEAKVEQLEQQVTDLQRSAGQESDSTADKAVLPDNIQEDNNTAAGSSGDTLDTLETAVSDAVKKVNSAKPSGSASDKRDQFFTLKHELESMEDRLDYYDDDMEAQYRQGSLSLEDYRAQEHSLELLENQLDMAEDTLEYTFGMDD